jgi:hypothetical protein
MSLKLKVGDTVRVLHDRASGAEVCCGDTGTIENIYNTYYNVRMHKDAYSWSLDDDDLELVASESPYEASPKLYRPGEAAQAAAFASKRAHVRSLLGLEDKHEEKEEKPAPNSIFECPYEAYDTKYGDW